MRKGERAEIEYGNEIYHGMIVKGGKNMNTMVIDGGKEEIVAGAEYFKPSTKPLANDPPSHMDKWAVVNFKEIGGHGDSRTFTAVITLNGKKVIDANSDGWGGPNEYTKHVLDGEDYREQFLKDCLVWSKNNGCDYYDADIWIEWYQFFRPLGITSKEYVSKPVI